MGILRVVRNAAIVTAGLSAIGYGVLQTKCGQKHLKPYTDKAAEKLAPYTDKMGKKLTDWGVTAKAKVVWNKLRSCVPARCSGK